MYTVQGINDVYALDAVTGKPIWFYAYKPDPIARNCCGQRPVRPRDFSAIKPWPRSIPR